MSYTSNQIENISKAVILEYSDNTQELNIVNIASRLGFNVMTTTFNDPNIAGQVISSNEEKSIYLNASDSYERQRFTLAHEIGHVVLHHPENEEDEYRMVDYRGRNQTFDPKEWEANIFAANILMPEEKTKQIWEQLNDVDDFARYFEVSRSAAAIRLNDLGLI